MAAEEHDVVEEHDTQEPGPEGYEIKDLAEAKWAAHKLAQIVRQRKEADEAHEALIGRLNREHRAQMETVQNETDWWERVLLQFFHDREEKTLPLADGVKLERRKVADRNRVVWPETAEGLPEDYCTVKTTTAIDKKGVLGRVEFTEDGQAVEKETGEILDWLSLDPQKPAVLERVTVT